MDRALCRYLDRMKVSMPVDWCLAMRAAIVARSPTHKMPDQGALGFSNTL